MHGNTGHDFAALLTCKLLPLRLNLCVATLVPAEEAATAAVAVLVVTFAAVTAIIALVVLDTIVWA